MRSKLSKIIKFRVSLSTILIICTSMILVGSSLFAKDDLIPFVANILKISKNNSSSIEVINSDTENLQTKEDQLLSPKEIEEKDNKDNQPLKQMPLNIEIPKGNYVKPEAENLNVTKEDQNLIKKEELNEKESEQEAIIKIERCKSQFEIDKNNRITDFENYELSKIESSIKRIANSNYMDCMTDCLASTENSLGTSYLSPESLSAATSLCESTVCNKWLSFVDMTMDAIKDKEINKIEDELQLEYQQCLEE